jgi:hypothetical protein
MEHHYDFILGGGAAGGVTDSEDEDDELSLENPDDPEAETLAIFDEMAAELNEGEPGELEDLPDIVPELPGALSGWKLLEYRPVLMDLIKSLCRMSPI